MMNCVLSEAMSQTSMLLYQQVAAIVSLVFKRASDLSPVFYERKEAFHVLGHFDPWKSDRYVVPKRRCKTNLRCVTSQKTTEFKDTAEEVHDLVQ